MTKTAWAIHLVPPSMLTYFLKTSGLCHLLGLCCTWTHKPGVVNGIQDLKTKTLITHNSDDPRNQKQVFLKSKWVKGIPVIERTTFHKTASQGYPKFTECCRGYFVSGVFT